MAGEQDFLILCVSHEKLLGDEIFPCELAQSREHVPFPELSTSTDMTTKRSILHYKID